MAIKELVLWVTTNCNLKCRYCYAFDNNKSEYMPWAVAKKAIDTALETTDKLKVQIAGGEPLLNFGLVEDLVSYTKGKCVTYSLQTNATLITRELARKISDMGIGIGVSLDGIPRVNNHLRPKNDKTCSTVNTVNGINNLRKEGIGIGLTCVISEISALNLTSLIDFAAFLGNVKGISLDTLRPAGRALTLGVKEASPAQAYQNVSKALLRARELAELGGEKVSFRELKRMRYLVENGLKREHRCYFDACEQIMVKPNGDAYPCASLSNFSEFYLGNISDEGFLDSISKKLERCRALIPKVKKCSLCSYFESICGGPCPAQIYTQLKESGNTDTECSVRKAFIDYLKKEEREQNEKKLRIPV